MVPPPWLVDGFIPSAFREGGVEDGESVGGYWRGRKDFNRSPSRWTRKKGFAGAGPGDEGGAEELESLSNGEMEIEMDEYSFYCHCL